MVKFYIFVMSGPSYFFINSSDTDSALPLLLYTHECIVRVHFTPWDILSSLSCPSQEKKKSCYWYRNHFRSWPPFLTCLPILFPGRTFVLICGKIMTGQHCKVKRRISSSNAIHSGAGLYPPHLLHALPEWMGWLLPTFSWYLLSPLLLHYLGSFCS